jgi:RNA polymerase sigma-70 factor (ECF subfamily)
MEAISLECQARLPYPSLTASFSGLEALFWRGIRVAERADDAAWLARFHAGDRATLGAVYQEHFDSVHAAASRLLPSVDAETVTQEVFLRMVEETEFRAHFSGGALRAWLCTVARNRAIDVLRRQKRVDLVDDQNLEALAGAAEQDTMLERFRAQAIIGRFRREVLPAKWRAVFEARFIRQLSQREAATEVGVTRTTLAYQEMRVRGLLERFLLTNAAAFAEQAPDGDDAPRAPQPDVENLQ